MPKKAYINLFDNAHKYLRGEVMSPERVSTQHVILGYMAESAHVGIESCHIPPYYHLLDGREHKPEVQGNEDGYCLSMKHTETPKSYVGTVATGDN